MSHIWPMEWRHTDVPARLILPLAHYDTYESITEITDEKALQALKPYIPLLNKGNGGFFRWLGIIILIFELIYYWPHG